MRVLFVENQDSFSWNVIDALPFERRAIRICPGAELRTRRARLDEAGAVVIGPGPTDPVRAGLVDLVRAVADAALPLLGICLGHQALGLAFGARLEAVAPAHGKTTTARFAPSRLLPGFAGPERIMRYHSLALTAVPAPLRTTARTPDGIVMAIEHERLPMLGLQFHPDSYATPRGGAMIEAFFRAVS